jgi:hypothetical protein
VINVQVRGDLGNVVARAENGLEWTAAFADLDPAAFPMLRALDPCGDAVFNCRQVAELLAELERIPASCDGDWVRGARELCQVVGQGPHRYLWFVGD